MENRKPTFLSIHKKIILVFILSSAVAILLVGVTLNYVLKKTALDNWKKRQEFVTLEFAPQCDFVIEEAVIDLQFVSKLPAFSQLSHIDQIDRSINGVPETVEVEKRNILQNLIEMGDRFTSVILFRPNGDMYLVHPFKNQLKSKKYNFANRAYFKEVVRTRKPVVSDSFLSAAGNMVTFIIVPIMDKTGKVTAYLGGAYYLISLSRLVDKKQIGTFDAGFIVDRKGYLIAHTNTELLKKGIREHYVEHPLVSKFLNNSGEIAEKKDHRVMVEDVLDPVSGKRYLTSFVQLRSGWGLGLAQDKEKILSEVRPVVWRITIFVSFLIIVVSTTGVLFAQWIVKRWAITEQALKETEENVRLMVSEVKDYAIIMLDPNGNIATWNEGAQRIKGYTPDEIIGRHFSCFYPQEDIQNNKPEQELQDALDQGRFEDEGWRLRKDGSRFWANVVITVLRDETGNLVGFSKVTREITEKKQAEDELKKLNEELEQRVIERTNDLENATKILKESEERYRLITNMTSDYIYKMSADAEGQLTMDWATAGLKSITGYRTDHIKTLKMWEKIVYPDDFSGFNDFIKNIVSGKENYLEMRVTTKDGEMVWLAISGIPQWDADKTKVDSILGAGSDITKRKQAEDSLNRRTAELQKTINLMAGREMRMSDLKKAIQKLREQIESAGMTPVADDPLKETDKDIEG